MTDRFEYVKYDTIAVISQERFKKLYKELEAAINQELSEGRAKSLALTDLETSYMWIGKAIRDAQIRRS